jgi:hypothetical protein
MTQTVVTVENRAACKLRKEDSQSRQLGATLATTKNKKQTKIQVAEAHEGNGSRGGKATSKIRKGSKLYGVIYPTLSDRNQRSSRGTETGRFQKSMLGVTLAFAKQNLGCSRETTGIVGARSRK